jgi:hypothetical protein
MGRDLAGGLPCQAPSEGAPQSVARGALRSGDRAAQGMPRPRQDIVGAQIARYGVASSCGRDCSALRGLFASSPFAHPTPQSRRRASGDLFSASLGLISAGRVDQLDGTQYKRGRIGAVTARRRASAQNYFGPSVIFQQSRWIKYLGGNHE